jgi:N-acetylmuramoyl-L-alanine amidase
VNIDQRLLPINPFSRPGKQLNTVKGIVIHYVDNPGSTAMQNRTYWASLKNQSLNKSKAVFASADFIVGLDGEIIQTIPLNEMAYHVGANFYTPEAITSLGPYPNNCTIGVELTHTDKTERLRAYSGISPG